MKETIESIWQQGFLAENALVAPKVNNLYQQKSQDLVSKFERMFTINTIGIIAAVIVLFTVLASFGFPWLALFIDVLLLVLVAAGKRAKKQLTISHAMNSYQYLTTFNDWLKGQIQLYTSLYRYFYPLVVLSILIQIRYSESGQAIINSLVIEDPQQYLVLGTPLSLVLFSAMITFVVWLSSAAFYRWDLDLVYGKELKKLELLIDEMEQLQQN